MLDQKKYESALAGFKQDFVGRQWPNEKYKRNTSWKISRPDLKNKQDIKECNMKNRKEARAWDDAFDREFFTPEEISESDMRADTIKAMIEAREEMRVIKGG